jgi:hypothetical protein
LRDVRAWSRQVSRPGVIVRLFGVRLASADGSYGLTPGTAKKVRRPATRWSAAIAAMEPAEAGDLTTDLESPSA